MADVRDDVKFAADGGRFLFAVDAFDVIRFCFPKDGRTSRSVDVDAQADYFSALSYILDRRPLRPFLLPEHLLELHDYVADAQQRHIKMREQDVALAFQLAASIGEQVDPEQELSTTAEQVSYVGDHFSLLLYLEAAERQRVGYSELSRLMATRLNLLAPSAYEGSDEPKLSAVLRDFSANYQLDRGFARYCEGVLREFYVHGGERDASNRADARSFDRLRQLNLWLHDARLRGDLSHPYRAFLLSSSRRMLRLMDATRSVPEFSADVIPRLVRVPDQIFAFVVSEPQTTEIRNPQGGLSTVLQTSREEVLETIDWLINLGSENTNSLRRAHTCSTCVLDGHSNNSCALRLACSRMARLERTKTEVLEPFVDRTENWALYTKLRDVIRNEESPPSGAESSQLIQRFVRDEAVARRTSAELSVQRAIVRARAVLLYQGTIGLPTRATSDISDAPPLDFVRGAQSAMPWLMRCLNEEHQALLQRLRGAFFSSVEPETRAAQLNSAFSQLLRPEVESGEDDENRRSVAERDLLRALFFLSLRDRSAEDSAVDLAKVVLATATDDLLEDAIYLLTWALRRVTNIKESIHWADVGISRSGSDPRFWHGRALAKYSAYQRNPVSQHNTVISIRADFDEASRLYAAAEFMSDPDRRLFEASCLNANSYLLAEAATSEADLVIARSYLSRLKTAFGRKEAWSPQFPEFYHTEAFLELREAHQLKDPTQRREKLENAQLAAAEALDLAPNRPDYRALVEEIQAELQ